MGLPLEIQKLMLEMQIESIERQRRAVLADPIKHKATLHFPTGSRLNWRFWGTVKARGRRVRYCYSTERNLAGYFLCWRETVNLKSGMGERDQIIASKRRTTVREKARARYEAHKARARYEAHKARLARAR